MLTAPKPRSEKLLSARAVMAAGDGMHLDGGGLYLVVSGSRKSWIWRYRFGDRRRDMGLGSLASVSLAEARQERDRWRRTLKDGLDPIEERTRLRYPMLSATKPNARIGGAMRWKGGERLWKHGPISSRQMRAGMWLALRRGGALNAEVSQFDFSHTPVRVMPNDAFNIFAGQPLF